MCFKISLLHPSFPLQHFVSLPHRFSRLWLQQDRFLALLRDGSLCKEILCFEEMTALVPLSRWHMCVEGVCCLDAVLRVIIIMYSVRRSLKPFPRVSILCMSIELGS